MPGLLNTASLDGVRVGTSRYLATNVTVLFSGRQVLVVDAPYFPDELAALPAFAKSPNVRLFATHSHFDHLMSRFAFPSAPLLIGRATAEELASDPVRPMQDLTEEDARTYVRREKPLLFGALQGVAVPGWLELGDQEVELIEASGHTADGSAVWAGWAGVLCCGDYLSDQEVPLISAAGSVPGYRATLERLRPFVEEARLVVPGHGTPCPGRVALRRLEADLRYLEALEAGSSDPPLPPGRDSSRQREIHRANLKRHGGSPPAGSASKPKSKSRPKSKSGSKTGAKS